MFITSGLGYSRDMTSQEKAQLIQDVVDRVAANQDGAPSDTVSAELTRGFAEAGVDLSDGDIQKIADAIDANDGNVNAAEVLG